MKRQARIPHGILWEGPSPHDGAPIVAIATEGSSNEKTGPMIQVWILRADMDPRDAIAGNLDVSVCGTSCPLRGDAGLERGCYVFMGFGPRTVWETYRDGKYARITPRDFAGRKVRWGAYGDPAMLPLRLVREVSKHAAGTTGYTHQWTTKHGRKFAGLLMASVESLAGETKARAMGFGTFRIGLKDGSDQGASELCAFKADGLQCYACMRCDGAKRAIYVPAHGFGARHVPAERLLRRKVA